MRTRRGRRRSLANRSAAGHTSTKLTLDTYGRWLPARSTAASNAVSAPSDYVILEGAPRVIRTPDLLIRSTKRLDRADTDRAYRCESPRLAVSVESDRNR